MRLGAESSRPVVATRGDGLPEAVLRRATGAFVGSVAWRSRASHSNFFEAFSARRIIRVWSL